MNWLESKVKVSPFPKAEEIRKGLYESFWFPQGEAFGLSLESYGKLRNKVVKCCYTVMLEGTEVRWYTIATTS